MAERVLIGLLTPSSNTVLEPLAAEVLAEMPEVTAHFGRFRVTEISLSDAAVGQFDHAPQLEAACLLADARPQVIAWAGTSGGWLGVERDRDLCRRITLCTGVPATTSTLALLDAFSALDLRRYALVTPYLDGIQAAIVRNLSDEGYECVAERHLRDRGNFSFSEVPEAKVAEMVREVAGTGAEAVAIHCTNLAGTRVAPQLERELGLPVLDSIAVTLWRALALAGVEPGRTAGWGRIFGLPVEPTGRRRRTS